MNTCGCGCGQEVKPGRTFRQGHNSKHGQAKTFGELPDPNPSGLCMCGCGEPTSISTFTSARHQRYRGKHVRFISGHHSRVIVGPARVQWKGGRVKTSGGYWAIRNIGSRRGEPRYKLEHRVVMERHLGRALGAHEQVHHINGDKLDNRLENLELWTRSHPEGIRITGVHCAGCTCISA